MEEHVERVCVCKEWRVCNQKGEPEKRERYLDHDSVTMTIYLYTIMYYYCIEIIIVCKWLIFYIVTAQ